MTIKQTIEIPADRRITVPREVPAGPVRIIYTTATVDEGETASTEEAMNSARKILAEHLPAFKELAK